MSEHADKYHSPNGGLNDAGRKHFKETDGSNLKKGVTNYDAASVPDKKRWISWAKRFAGNPQPLTKPNGEPTPYALMFKAWGRPIPKTADDVKATYKLAVRRGSILNSKEKAMDYTDLAAGAELAKLEPLDQDLYDATIAKAKKKFKVFPSFYANLWVVQEYKKAGGKFKGGSSSDSKKPAFLKSQEAADMSADDAATLRRIQASHTQLRPIVSAAAANAVHPGVMAVAADCDAFLGTQLASIDAFLPDAVAQDAGTQDAGTQDAGTQDAGAQEAGDWQAAAAKVAESRLVDQVTYDKLVRLAERVPEKDPTSLQAAQVPTTKAFVTTHHGKTMVTGPAATFTGGWQKALGGNEHMLWIQGRLVGGETPNRNNALWTAGDLEMGNPTVAHGPLNWLHEARHVIGSIADSRFIPGRSGASAGAEQARYYSDKDRAVFAKSGVALPDGSWPIPDRSSLRDAVAWASTPTERKHLLKRAKALDAMDLIPDAWKQGASEQASELAAETVDPHIVAAANIWQWIWPDEATVVQHASEMGQLWYSMECVSKTVICSGEGGCGHEVDYFTYAREEPGLCQHMQDKSTTRRFADPTFLGAAVIVPPTRPGWADADAQVMQAASAQSEKAFEQAGRPDVAASTFEQIVGQVLKYAEA